MTTGAEFRVIGEGNGDAPQRDGAGEQDHPDGRPRRPVHAPDVNAEEDSGS